MSRAAASIRPYLPLRDGRRGSPAGPVPRAATIALEIGAAGVPAGPLARRGRPLLWPVGHRAGPRGRRCYCAVAGPPGPGIWRPAVLKSRDENGKETRKLISENI